MFFLTQLMSTNCCSRWRGDEGSPKKTEHNDFFSCGRGQADGTKKRHLPQQRGGVKVFLSSIQKVCFCLNRKFYCRRIESFAVYADKRCVIYSITHDQGRRSSVCAYLPHSHIEKRSLLQSLLPFWQAAPPPPGGAESFWWSSILVIKIISPVILAFSNFPPNNFFVDRAVDRLHFQQIVLDIAYFWIVVPSKPAASSTSSVGGQ